MTKLFDQIDDLQRGLITRQPGVAEKPDRVVELELQVTNLTEKRIEHLEKLQQQQMEMQVGNKEFRTDPCGLFDMVEAYTCP